MFNLLQGKKAGRIWLCVLCAIAMLPAVARGQEDVVLAHPLFDSFFSCTEHFAGQFQGLGDALGTDCVVQRLAETRGRAWLRTYKGKGARNEDWYGWHEAVLSPCDCEVVKVHDNASENRPGVMGASPAGFIILKRADDVHFMLAHVRSISVKAGSHIKQGQAVAQVGNNGYSRHPHIHIGAWKGEKPMQIRFDQTKMRLPQEWR